MAVTADQITPWSDNELAHAPASAATTFYDGTVCFITEAGLADITTATGQNLFGGLVIRQVDNAAGAASAKAVEFRVAGVGTFPGTGFAQTDVGTPLYATDNYTFTKTPSASAVRVGTITEYISSTKVRATIDGAKWLGASSTVSTKTADYTVLASESGKTFSTAGASGTVVFSMPPAVPGLKYRFYVGAAQELRIDPNGTETASLPSSGVAQAAGAYLTANAVGETIDLECAIAGSWSVFGYTGTWTAV